MRTNEARLSALALALALTGCLEPKSHVALQGADGGPGSPPGGPWSVCEDAAVHGVGGDTCAFPTGYAGCGIPQENLDVVPERETPAGYGETTFWATAACLTDREMLIRSQRWESWVIGDCSRTARRTDDGCIELTECSNVDTWCVPNAYLPIATEGPLVELDSPEDCVALRDDAEARPGSPCSGEQICYVAFPPAGGGPGNFEPALVWCHGERLRFSLTYYFPSDYENVTLVLP